MVAWKIWSRESFLFYQRGFLLWHECRNIIRANTSKRISLRMTWNGNGDTFCLGIGNSVLFDVDSFVLFLSSGWFRTSFDLWFESLCYWFSTSFIYIERAREGFLGWNNKKTRDSSFSILESVTFFYPSFYLFSQNLQMGLFKLRIFWNYGVEQFKMAWIDFEVTCNLKLRFEFN